MNLIQELKELDDNDREYRLALYKKILLVGRISVIFLVLSMVGGYYAALHSFRISLFLPTAILFIILGLEWCLFPIRRYKKKRYDKPENRKWMKWAYTGACLHFIMAIIMVLSAMHIL